MANTTLTTSKPQRVVSGMRPTGDLHIGHLRGVLSNWCNLQNTAQCFFFVADWHALTTDYADADNIANQARSMTAAWLAAGITPDKAVIFRQSNVPAHAELFALLSMICPLPWLFHMPTYKEQKENMQKNLDTYGFLGYPLLQAADIMIYGADAVPVGEDQIPHIEFTRDIARRFNRMYGNTESFTKKLTDVRKKIKAIRGGELEEALLDIIKDIGQGKLSAPDDLSSAVDETAEVFATKGGDAEDLVNMIEWIKETFGKEGGDANYLENTVEEFNSYLTADEKRTLRGYMLYDGEELLRAPRAMLTEAPKLFGTDGRKMSKSYDNTIALFDPPEVVDKKIKVMQTDPQRIRRTDKGDPDKCPVWKLHQVFSDTPTREWVQTECRSAGIGCIDCKKKLSGFINEELAPILERRSAINDKMVDDILHEGGKKAQQEAEKTMSVIRNAMQL